jgi:hypothetical protein
MVGNMGVATPETYRKHFGSYKEACRRAGLDPNGPRPLLEGDAIDILSQYSLLGNTTTVRLAVHRSQETVASVLDKYGIRHTPGMTDKERREARAFAATMARRLAGMPDEETE